LLSSPYNFSCDRKTMLNFEHNLHSKRSSFDLPEICIPHCKLQGQFDSYPLLPHRKEKLVDQRLQLEGAIQCKNLEIYLLQIFDLKLLCQNICSILLVLYFTQSKIFKSNFFPKTVSSIPVFDASYKWYYS